MFKEPLKPPFDEQLVESSLWLFLGQSVRQEFQLTLSGYESKKAPTSAADPYEL